jgi:uncharacterized repeat protein (TIGR01451 family)
MFRNSRRFRRVLAGGATLAVLASTAVAFSPFAGTANAVTIPVGYFVVQDPNVDDQPNQKDINQMGRDDSNAGILKIFWSWDDTDFSGQAGDACALFSATANGFVTFAICGEVVNGATPGTVVLAATYPRGFTCTPTVHPLDRCDSSTPAGIGTTTAGPIVGGGTDLVTDTDPFHGAGTLDTTLAVNIDKSVLPAGADLVNVCSYPSAANGANNDPEDCIFTPGAGLIRVVKHTTGGDRTFDFTVDPGAHALSATTVAGTGTSTNLQVTKGTGYSVTETVPTNWLLSNASCALQGGGGTGTFDSLTHKVTSVEVEVGRLTECTFTNARDQGYLQIVKSATAGHNGTTFTFDVVCGPAGAPVFTADDVPVTINNSGNGTSTPLGPIETGNTCDVSEDTLPDWSVTTSPQTSGSISSTDTQANPEQVTFHNDRDTGFLEILKSATAGHAGATFTFDVVCGPAAAPVFTANNVAVIVDAAGNGTSGPVGPIETGNSCTVTEDSAAGWTSSGSTTVGPIVVGNTRAAPAPTTFHNTFNIVSLSLAKKAQDASYAAVGDVLNYTYTLTNTGNVTLTAPYAVGDDLIASVSCSLGPASLAPGQSFDCTGSYTVTQADLDAGIVVNHATATATYRGGPVTSNPSSAQVPAVQQPALGLVKTAAEASYSGPGDVLHYTYTLTDIGNVTLEAPYAVTDDRAATVDCPATPATLAPGESVECTADYEVTQSDVNDGSVTNHATATAMFGVTTVLSNEDEVTVPAIQDPLVTAHKSVNKKEAEYGDTLTYTVSATNTGNVDLTGVVVSDEIPKGTTYVDGSAEPAAIASFDAGDNTVSWAVGDLAVGETVDGLTFKVTVDQPDFDTADGIPATTIDNVASVRSDVSDPVPSNHVKTPVIAVLGIHEERPPPELPFTGSALPIPFAVGVAMLMLVGGALLTTPRRRRRA